MGASETLSWQKAVATLTAERGRAEAAVRIIKRLGDHGDITAAEVAYDEGRAETEAVIAALTVALEEGKGADDLADLEVRVQRAVAARETLGSRARALAARAPGEKGEVFDPLVNALPALLSGVGALWRRLGERDATTRATIGARLDAARWPAFADIVV